MAFRLETHRLPAKLRVTWSWTSHHHDYEPNLWNVWLWTGWLVHSFAHSVIQVLTSASKPYVAPSKYWSLYSHGRTCTILTHQEPLAQRRADQQVITDRWDACWQGPDPVMGKGSLVPDPAFVSSPLKALAISGDISKFSNGRKVTLIEQWARISIYLSYFWIYICTPIQVPSMAQQ